MRQEKSYEGGGGVKKAPPIPRVLDLSLDEDRGSFSRLLDTPGANATCEPLTDSLVVVWLHPDGATELLRATEGDEAAEGSGGEDTRKENRNASGKTSIP